MERQARHHDNMIGGDIDASAASAAPCWWWKLACFTSFGSVQESYFEIHQARAKSIGENDKTTRTSKPTEKVFIVVAGTHPKQLVQFMKEHIDREVPFPE